MVEEKVLLSRRDLLKCSTILGLGAFLPNTSVIETLLKEVSKEEVEILSAQAQEIKTYIRNLGQCGSVGLTGSTVAVDVKNGRILRIRSFHIDWQYDPKTFNPWKLEVNGKVFEPPLKILAAPYAHAYKKRVYSPARLRYPLKRVDFDHKAPPNKRNAENRGKSGFIRISWE
ncbi:MAG: hypothetical protein RMI79_06160, partial [Nitrososphaerota archaeon]|nr:hypothetical protein [Nitrososphaerota archaeon]